MRRLFPALCLTLLSATATAQEQNGYFSIGTGAPGESGRNVAFGHSGSRVVVAPSIGQAGHPGSFGILGIELRLDAHDELVEWGIPLMASVGWETEQRGFSLSGGLEHVGGTHRLGDLGDLRLSTQLATYGSYRERLAKDVHATLRAGVRDYDVSSGTTAGIQRTWAFAEFDVSARVRPGVDLGLTGELQQWWSAMATDRFRPGTTSMVVQMHATWEITRDVGLTGRVGSRWDQDGAMRSDFFGVDVLWAPRVFELEEETNTPSCVRACD